MVTDSGAGFFPEGVLVICLLILAVTGVLTTHSPTASSGNKSTGEGALSLEGVVLVGTAGAGPFFEGVEEALETGVMGEVLLTGGRGASHFRPSPDTGTTT